MLDLGKVRGSYIQWSANDAAKVRSAFCEFIEAEEGSSLPGKLPVLHSFLYIQTVDFAGKRMILSFLEENPMQYSWMKVRTKVMNEMAKLRRRRSREMKKLIP